MISHTQYINDLDEIERLMDSDPDPETPEGKRLDLLVERVEEYEKICYPMGVNDAKTHRP